MIEILPYFAGAITLLASFGFGYAISRPFPSKKAEVQQPIIPAETKTNKLTA